MPTISIFFGIVIQMYWKDHNPPHIHALYQAHEGLFSIETSQLIIGRLPRRAEALISEWIVEHRSALIDNWQRGRMGVPFEQIPGADER